jgi:hypothetical protein
MSSIEVVGIEEGNPRIIIGRRKYPLEEIDETHYQVIISPKTLSRYLFKDLPAPETRRGNILIEFLPFTRRRGEYLYEAHGLKFFHEVSIWRDNDRGHVYLEYTINNRDYAFNSWIPVDLYTYIVVKQAKELGFESEVYRDEANVIIETEKTYPLDTPIRIALLEVKELDRKTYRLINRIIEKIMRNTLKYLSRELGVSVEELESILKSPEEKLSTLP